MYVHNYTSSLLQLCRSYAVLLRPNRTKYVKSRKNIRAVLPVAPPGKVSPPPLKFGNYGIYAKESIRLKDCQIEAAKMALVRTIGRRGLELWVRVFPHIPVTKKPLEVRMGKGKGSVDHFIANVKAGKLLYEYNCQSTNVAKLAFRAASFKLPIPTGYVKAATPAEEKL